jgi:hypothetical protein
MALPPQSILARSATMPICSRRNLLKFASTFIPMSALALRRHPDVPRPDGETLRLPIADTYPSQPHELVREMVTVSHFDLKRVQELVEARPSLARAAWDWGFGDWESALGAASHTGNRPIAEYLIGKGARPSLFSAAMLGQLEVVKGFISAHPGVQRTRGPHSISLLAHAKAGGAGARSVYDFLQSLGDAGSDTEAPLPDVETGRLLGTYVFGIGVNQAIDVTLERNNFLKTSQLTWTRKGTVGRPLYHLGNRVFYPAGASEVRIRFVDENDTIVMSVNDPELVLTAKRSVPAK